MFIQKVLICVLLSYVSGQVELKKEYKLERYFKANWFDAYIFCRDHAMQLATVNTADQHNAIVNLIKGMDFDNFWLSGTDLAQDGRYVWFSNGQTISFNGWDYNQPIELQPAYFESIDKVDNAEDCVQIRGEIQRWWSTNCTELNYFICERI